MNADLMNGTIVMSQNEARKAGRIGTAEYAKLAELRQQFSAFRIEVVKPSAKTMSLSLRAKRSITYDGD